MRIWHVIDAVSPQATTTTLALLRESLGRAAGVEQRVILLGGSLLCRAAQAAGIRDSVSIGVPAGRAVMGTFAVQSRMRREPPPNVVHCWSVGSFSLAALLWRRAAKVLTLTVAPPNREVRWLRVVTSDAAPQAVVLPISSTIRRAVLAQGVRESAVHVLRPGLDMARVAHAARQELRAQWKVEDPQFKVVALLTDPPHGGDAFDATMAAALANPDPKSSDWQACILVHPAARSRRRAARLIAQVDRSHRFLVDERLDRPWLVLPGCDVALAQGTGAGGLSLLWAMCANVPIVGEATYAISEVVEDRHSALLARPGAVKYLAHRLRRLLCEPQLAWRLRDTARHEAYSFFSRQRYVQNLHAVYEQVVAGRPVEVPPPPSTGGMRFTGRG